MQWKCWWNLEIHVWEVQLAINTQMHAFTIPAILHVARACFRICSWGVIWYKRSFEKKNIGLLKGDVTEYERPSKAGEAGLHSKEVLFHRFKNTECWFFEKKNFSHRKGFGVQLGFGTGLTVPRVRVYNVFLTCSCWLMQTLACLPARKHTYMHRCKHTRAFC